MAADRDLKVLILHLKVHGLWYSFNGRYKTLTLILQLARLVFFVALFPLLLASMFKVPFKECLLKYGFIATSGFYIIMQQLSHYFNREEAQVLMDRFVNIHKKRSQPWHLEIFIKYSQAIWKIVAFFNRIGIFYIVSYFGFPLLYDIYLLSTGQSVEPFNFPFPLEVLGNKKHSFYYYVLLLLGLFWSIFLISYGLGTITLLWIVVSYCCIDIRIICRSVLEFGKYGNNVCKMGKLIEDHCETLELYHDIKQMIGCPMAVQNAVAPIFLTMFIYSIKILLKYDVFLLAMNIFCLSSMVTIMFFSCFIGETLQSEGIKLYETFYELPWYRMTPDMRRSLSCLILVSSKPLVIDYKGKLALNLQTFMEVIYWLPTFFWIGASGSPLFEEVSLLLMDIEHNDL